jgi:CubicO group peptidase (beta-lactamase class C family)
MRDELDNVPTNISKEEVLRHNISPQHTRNVPMETVDEAREKRFPIEVPAWPPGPPGPPGSAPHLDLGAFGLRIYNALKDKVVGYILQIRQHGNLVHVGSWNWAQTPADKNLGWNENTQMHIASVSKFLTAVGMVKCLDDHGKSYKGEDKIVDYLPEYWRPGKNVNLITFRHLLTNRSGFKSVPPSSDSDYTFMKNMVEAGVSSVGSYDYENMNFGLCRILLPVVAGDLNRNVSYGSTPEANDQAWDFLTIYKYVGYMLSKVLSPAGAETANCEPTHIGPYALAYPWPNDGQNGWNSGNLKTMLGGAGWRLTAKQLLGVMDHVRRKNTIIDQSKTEYMLDNYFGIDQIISTPAGKLYNKNGGWGGYRKEQCVAYFLPNDMELALFVNSHFGDDSYSIRALVTDAFKASLVS